MRPIVLRLRRRLRFSLLSIFALITGVCLALGLWVVPARRVDRAVELMQQIGANVFYTPQPDGILPSQPRGPLWLRRLTANHSFDSPRELFFKKDTVLRPPTNDDLRSLELFRRLDWLEIEPGLTSDVTDAGIAHIAKATSLRLIRLRTQPLSDAALIHFASLPRLEHLELYQVAMHGDGFSAFQGHASLKDIELYGHVDLPHVAMRHLKHVQTLRSIHWNLHDNPEWTDLAMEDGDGFQQLESFFLQGRISDRAYEQLRRFSNLSWLSLAPSDPLDDNLKNVAQMPKLKELLLYSHTISDRGFEALKEATGLERLTVYNAEHLTNASFESLVNLPHLQHVDIRSAPFDDNVLRTLARMNSLKWIHIVDARISKAAVKQFIAEHPALRVEIAATNR